MSAQATTKLPSNTFTLRKEKAGAAFSSVVFEEGRPSGELLQVRNESSACSARVDGAENSFKSLENLCIAITMAKGYATLMACEWQICAVFVQNLCNAICSLA